MLKGNLKRLGYGNGKSGYGGDTPCSVSRCAKVQCSLKQQTSLSGCLLPKKIYKISHNFIHLATVAPFLFTTRTSINMTKQSKTTAFVATGLMLFALFFGSGNLIYPPTMGQKAGSEILPAMIGFLITGAGLPLLGVLAIAYSNFARHSRPCQPRGQSLRHYFFGGVVFDYWAVFRCCAQWRGGV